MKTEEPTIKVLYNSACPVCNAGIEAQKTKRPLCGVEWQDVHLDHELVAPINAELEFVRERLHVIDEHNELQIGMNAFIAIWRNTQGEQWKATLCSFPVLHPILIGTYNVFARLLYNWNKRKSHW